MSSASLLIVSDQTQSLPQPLTVSSFSPTLSRARVGTPSSQRVQGLWTMESTSLPSGSGSLLRALQEVRKEPGENTQGHGCAECHVQLRKMKAPEALSQQLLHYLVPPSMSHCDRCERTPADHCRQASGMLRTALPSLQHPKLPQPWPCPWGLTLFMGPGSTPWASPSAWSVLRP